MQAKGSRFKPLAEAISAYLRVRVSGVHHNVRPQVAVPRRHQGLFVQLDQTLGHQLNHIMVFVQFM